MSDSVRPHRRQSNRLLCPWDSPGKNTGVGCHFFLQCMKVKSESEVSQSCPTQRPHGLQPTRLLHPWDSPGKSTGVKCHCLLQNLGYSFWIAIACNTLPPSLMSPLTTLPAIHSVYPHWPLQDSATFWLFCRDHPPLPHSLAWTLPRPSDLCSHVLSPGLFWTPHLLYNIPVFSLQSTHFSWNESCLSSCLLLPSPRKLCNSRKFTVLWIFVLFWNVSLFCILTYNKRTKNLDKWQRVMGLQFLSNYFYFCPWAHLIIEFKALSHFNLLMWLILTLVDSTMMFHQKLFQIVKFEMLISVYFSSNEKVIIRYYFRTSFIDKLLKMYLGVEN